MISTLLIFFSLLFTAPDLSTNQLIQIRDMYVKASKNQSDSEFFNDYLKNYSPNDEAIIQGYYGVSYVFLAQFGWNPFAKHANFTKGTEILEEALSKEPNNIELRYLRMSVQSQAPDFLGYNENVDDDRAYIREVWENIDDSDLKVRISDFMNMTFDLDEEEKTLYVASVH